MDRRALKGSKSQPGRTTGRRRLIPAAAAVVLLALLVATGVALPGPGTSSTWIWALGAAATVIFVLVVVMLVRRGRRAAEEAGSAARGAGERHPAGGRMAEFVYSKSGYLDFQDTSRKRDTR